MSTSKTYQQSIADAGSKNRPPMLERGSYIPCASRFRRYLNRKRDNRKWLLKALDEGPYGFKNFVLEGSTIPRLQTAEDLEGDDLLLHDAEMEVMNMILLSIPNEIYNSVDACTSAKDMWKRVAKHGSSSRQSISYYVVTSYCLWLIMMMSYQQDDVHNNSEDPLVSAMLLLAKAITQNFSNPTNNRLRASSNTRNQAIIQGDRVNIQSRNSGNTGRNNRRAYVQEEVVEGMNAPNETGNVQRTLRTPSSGNTSTVQCYNCSGKGHYARNYEQNDFLFADASRMEEIEELSANICLMARIQPADHTSDDGPSCESAFISEVQSSSIDENNEQMYPTHTKIINSTIGNDQINSNIKFDSFKGSVNSGSVEKDTHVPDLCAIEKLARNAYQEAEKQQIFAQQVQKQNTHLTSQLEMYKERVRILESINKDNNYLNEFLEADERAKRYNKQAQSQLVRDRDIIRDLEKQRDKLDLDVKNYKQKNEELQKTHSILKRQMSEKEDTYHDTILDLEAKLKKNVDLILKLDSEDTLEDAFKSQQKMNEKMNDPIAVANKQNCWTINYKQLNALYEDFVPQKELSVEQRYFSSSSIPSVKISERDNVKIEYQKLFDSIKKTRSQTQKELDELIVRVSEKTYAYGAIRAENLDLLSTISELKTRLKKVKKGVNATSRVRRPISKDSSVTNSVLVNFKKAAKNVSVYVRKNKQKDNTSANVISNKENVIDFDVENASKAKTLLCFSCMQNVLIPYHDKCLAKHKLNVRLNVRRTFSTNSRTPKSLETIYVAPKTRFSKKETQSKTLDTTSVVSKSKIDVESASKAKDKVVQIVLWVVDSGCSKHMTGDRSLLRNFIEKFMGTVRFGNDNFAAITGYGDYIHGNITICHVYYVEGLGHNLFSVGQFCDRDLEVAFRSNTCYVRNLQRDDLLTGGRDSNLYTISISDMAASSPICLMSKATSTKSWLWHRRLSHLNFGTINDLTRLDLVDGLPKFKYGKDHLCSACERGKSKKASHPPKLVPSDHSKLELLHMDLCGPMRVASINGKKYILVIVDDYSRYTWVYFLRSKDETPEIIKKFIAQAQLNYKAKVCKIRTDNGTEFKNTTLKAHYEKLGIMQQFSIARTPQQNGVVERRNRTLVEAARTMLIFSRLPKFL
ncbi:integrase, catalytic region, zinc finger, CCHC-type containing protein [Tanacetum coccineum]